MNIKSYTYYIGNYYWLIGMIFQTLLRYYSTRLFVQIMWQPVSCICWSNPKKGWALVLSLVITTQPTSAGKCLPSVSEHKMGYEGLYFPSVVCYVYDICMGMYKEYGFQDHFHLSPVPVYEYHSVSIVHKKWLMLTGLLNWLHIEISSKIKDEIGW